MATIEGELLHQLIQCYFESDPSQAFRPRKALLQLISEYPNQHPDEKIAIKSVIQRVSLHDVTFGFVKALELIRAEGGTEHSFVKPIAASSGQQMLKQKRGGIEGVEKWIEVAVASVTLCGRLDYYIDGVLIDFKSGAPHAHHTEQVAFYSALIRKKTGHSPKRAKVYYSSSGVSVDVPVPTEKECDEILLRYARMAETASLHLCTNRVEALPERDNCSFCPCKFNCDAYWKVVVPQLMADPELSTIDAVGNENASVDITSSFSTVSFTASYGSVEILFPHHIHIGIENHDLRTCRVIRARKRQRDRLISIVLTEQSEISVVEDKPRIA